MASSMCIKALRGQVTELMTKPITGIFAVPSDEDFLRVDALVIGPEDTPYHGGFFHFDMKFPQDYPVNPPHVLLMTTDGKTVRFNPNLYASGKCCLSILGTWEGPGWKPGLTLSSVLLSLQSLMNEFPYHNEPGFESENPVAAENYNARVRYETLRVAICQNIEAVLDHFDHVHENEKNGGNGKHEVNHGHDTTTDRDDPNRVSGSQHALKRFASKFGSEMLKSFLSQYDKHVEICERECEKYNGKRFADPFRDMRGYFHYSKLLPQLKSLKSRVEACLERMEEDDSDSDSSNGSESDESVHMIGDDELE